MNKKKFRAEMKKLDDKSVANLREIFAGENLSDSELKKINDAMYKACLREVKLMWPLIEHRADELIELLADESK